MASDPLDSSFHTSCRMSGSANEGQEDEHLRLQVSQEELIKAS